MTLFDNVFYQITLLKRYHIRALGFGHPSLDPILLVNIATFGNVLGAFVNYAAGFWGSTVFIRKSLQIPENEFIKAKQRFKKYGAIGLLFAWVPVVGDPLTVIAGVLRVNIIIFLILVTTGKLTRYIIVSYAILIAS